MRLLLIWLINTAAIFALPHLLATVQVDSFTTALYAALILGLVNTLIRPVLLLLTLPVTVRVRDQWPDVVGGRGHGARLPGRELRLGDRRGLRVQRDLLAVVSPLTLKNNATTQF